MNSEQAINQFWNSFGWRAVDEQSAYDDRMDLEFPYITYSVAVSELDEPVALTADLWDRSTSWKMVTEKSQEIAKYIKNMNPIPLDKGYMWITTGSPFAQRMAEDTGLAEIRRVYLNINVEFLTTWR